MSSGKRASRKGCSLVLTHSEVRAIKRLIDQTCPACKQKITVTHLARQFNVSKQTIYQIKWGRIRYGKPDV